MRFKIGLALGGGGVRGLAHIGIFKVLEQANIPIDLIVGTSMGAIVGGAYALSVQTLSLQEKILELLRRKEIARLESLAGKTRPEDKELIVQGLLSFVKDLGSLRTDVGFPGDLRILVPTGGLVGGKREGGLSGCNRA